MDKIFLKCVAFITASVILTGCGNSNSSNPVSLSPSSSAPVSGSASCTPDPVGSELAVTPKYSQAFFWCWAASGEMCVEFLNGGLLCQCDEVNYVLSHNDCCSGDNSYPGTCDYFYYPSGSCNQTGWPDFNHYGFSPNETSNAPLAFSEIENQLSCKQSPVVFSWHWVGGGGHMMVAKGYVADSLGLGWVTVNDPDQTYTIMPYQEYDTDANPSDAHWQAHTHWNDYYDIRKP